jgi:hypothetical protein
MIFPTRSHTFCAVVLLCLAAYGPACAARALHDSSQPAIIPTDLTDDAASASEPPETLVIPGPLRSFLRMAGISQEISTEEVLPTLARNAALYGYQGGKETEYLILVNRYLHLGRELLALADANGAIHISNCDEAARLVQVLGYRFQHPCGEKDVSLSTANAERAFLTIDSGFPLTGLEEALSNNQPFTYSFPATRVPIFFRQQDWIGVSVAYSRRAGEDLIDELLHDQNLDRVYAALARCDGETRSALLQSPGLRRLVTLAPAFDLYGSGITIHSGRVVVPAEDDKAWEDLVDASARNPGEFVVHLFTRDSGWLAAYYDVLTRLNRAQQARIAEGNRLRRLYSAYHSSAGKTNAASGVFPKNADLLMLLTSVKWEPNGDPQIPGGLGAWQEILTRKNRTNYTREWIRRGRSWENPERLLETLVASSNIDTDSGPMQIFLMLAAMNAGRPREHSLSDATEELIARRIAQFNRWFPIFAEFPALDDNSVERFVSAADHISAISNPTLRANALGAFQADVGLWQILARQGQIPIVQLNDSWQGAVLPFISAGSSVQLFDAARASLQSTLKAAGVNRPLTQDEIVDLLAGPPQDSPDGQRVHQQLAGRIRAVLDDQRLVSLDTLFGLFDGLGQMAKGARVGDSLLPLAGNLREFEMPRPIFTGSERSSWSPVVYTARHAELQIRTDLTRILKSPGNPAQLESARGQLTPFLRDTLVGLNYAYYEPPGAEVLHNNPLFVRSHDFSSVSVQGFEQIWGMPELIGVGATAGGGAYLMGSLADLPYALASTEEDFIAPRNVQALIWKEVVPDLLVGAILPRWWTVNHHEMHAAALYQRAGEELIAASGGDSELKEKVLGILSDRMRPDRMERTTRALQSAERARKLVGETLPSDEFYLAVEFRKRYPDQAAMGGPAGQELEELARKYPDDTNPDRLAATFGAPHPVLVITNSCTLLNMKPMSAFGGNASRLLAESWESNNLYWARLADEMGYSPVMLNVLIPTLTRHMVSNIFASNIDDWPALLRAMEVTGDEFRRGKIAVQPVNSVARQ